MLRAHTVLPASPDRTAAFDAVSLDYDARHRRRMFMKADRGTEFLLELPQAVALRHGDGLLLDDGRVVEIRAAPEHVAEISAPSPAALTRIAWHLGNRHLPTQLLGDRLRIRRDHVIEELVRRLGGTVTPVEAAFDPEGGAYGLGEVHAHDHAGGHHG